MKALVATQISTIVSTTAPERLTGQTEWVAGVHASGDVVTVAAAKRVYKCAYATTSSDPSPDVDIANNQIPKWADAGPMNQWAAFDGKVGSVTVGPEGDLTFAVNPGAVSSVWIGGIANTSAAHVVARKSTGGDVYFDQTISLHQPVTTFFGWWFDPFALRSDALFDGIDIYPQCELTITLETLGTASVGMIAIDRIEDLGQTLAEPSTRFVNYSAKKLDDTWGPSEGTGGVVTRDQHFVVLVPLDRAPAVNKFMLRAMKMPAVWLPDDRPNYEGLRGYGQATDGELTYSKGLSFAQLDLTIRGFI